MEEFIVKYIGENVSNSIVAVLLMLFVVNQKNIFNLFGRLSIRVRKEYNVLEHEFLISKSYYINIINSIDFRDDDHKTNILRIIMNNKINTVIDMTIEHIKNFDFTLSEIRLKEVLYLHVINMVQCYENKILEEFTKQYGAKRAKILYNIVYKKFKTYHDDRVDFINSYVKTIKILNNIKDKKLVVYVFVTLLKVAIDLSVEDIKVIFNNFNGQIQMLVYDKKFGDIPEE